MELIFILIFIAYSFLIFQLVIGFNKVKDYSISEKKSPKTSYTIVVPFRNEAKNLNNLLNSLSNLNYPKELIEIIMIDDDSKDNSSSIFIRWRMKNDEIDTTLLENLRLSNSPKKDAITRAIPIVKNQWIITTDADCEVKPNWLLTYDNYIQNNNFEMIAAPVVYKTKNNWFHHFQQLDLLSLQGTTIGSFGIGKPFMCNGANFAYTKKLFQELDGFEGNNSFSSGDDVFLLQKAIQKHPEKVSFLKSKAAIVTTKPENDFFKLFIQRVRWGSKTSGYLNSYPKILALVVLTINAIICYGFIGVIFSFFNWKLFILLFGIKYFTDLILLYKSNKFLNKNRFFIPLATSIVYPFFTTAVGIYSLFGTFNWKGRNFKR